MQLSKKLNPALKDISYISSVICSVRGLTLGLMLFTYSAFLYEKFCSLIGTAKALHWTVIIAIITEVCILLSEVPTGAIADHIGRRKSVIISFILATLSYFFRAWLSFVSTMDGLLVLAILGAVFYALSFTFYSGCFVAWVADSVRVKNITEGPGSILSNAYSNMFLAQMIGAVIGLTLYLTGYIFYSFAVCFMATLLCALFCIIVMKETENMYFHQGPISARATFANMKQIIVTGLKTSLKTPPLIFLTLIYGFFKFLLDIIDYLWPVAMQANFGLGKMSPYWFLIVFSGLIMAFIGSKFLGKLNNSYKGEKLAKSALWPWYTSVSLIIACLVVTLGINSINRPMPLSLFIVSIACAQFGYGFLNPLYNILINAYIPNESAKHRATILSFGSMFISFLTIFLMLPSSGPDGQSIAVGWLLPAGMLIVLTLIVHILMRRYQRKIGEIPSAAGAPVVQEG